MPAYIRKPQPAFAGLTLERVLSFRPALAVWGIGAGAAVALFASDIPLFQKDVLQKIPVINSYFTDKTPDSDKPF
ncbi:cytochrome b-c1 complex subunit 10 [Papiliotrema laurentii]|uniref:Cytochrome b-c1 complex subunit 10 n=1 Tax=Papiliotrema laurentii TaxID=5418 RepID=A0AAD9FX45_PAPLA|nr:cytochrome b-c1 complex subunit 10 [Papiliotrema laurentii]